MTETNSTKAGARTQGFRLTIGKDEMNAFAGLSDGDAFMANGQLYKVRMHEKYGITLRPNGDPFSNALPGFCNLPDYHSFVRAVNDAARNGLAEGRAQ